MRNSDKELSVEVSHGMLKIIVGVRTLAEASSWDNGGPIKANVRKGKSEKWAELVASTMNESEYDSDSPLEEFMDKVAVLAAQKDDNCLLWVEKSY